VLQEVQPLENPPQPETSSVMSALQRSNVVSMVLHDSTSFLEEMEKIVSELDEVQKPLVRRTQALLSSLEGCSFDSFEENQAFAVALRSLLTRLGKGVKCIREDCDEPAIMDCKLAGNAKNGIFQTRHVINGVQKPHGASTKLPLIEVVDQPVDRRRLAVRKRG
jgi:hypothetical protein